MRISAPHVRATHFIRDDSNQVCWSHVLNRWYMQHESYPSWAFMSDKLIREENGSFQVFLFCEIF